MASAVVLVLFSAGAVRGQNGSAPPAGTEASIRHDVAMPSSDFTTYIEGERIRVSVPSNWRELPGWNAVTFAPEGAYGNIGVKSVFTHGLGLGFARTGMPDLQRATDEFIASHVLGVPDPGRTFASRAATIGSQPGRRAVLSGTSPSTGDMERIEVFTMLIDRATLFYVLAVAPIEREADYAGVFKRILASIEIVGCDGCVR